MRTSLYVFSAALAAACTQLPAPAAAQSIPSPYTYLEERQEIGAFAGYMNVSNGRFNYGPRGGTLLGVRYGIELSGPLSFEGVLQYIDGTRWVVDPGRAEGDRRLTDGVRDDRRRGRRRDGIMTWSRPWPGGAARRSAGACPRLRRV